MWCLAYNNNKLCSFLNLDIVQLIVTLVSEFENDYKVCHSSFGILSNVDELVWSCEYRAKVFPVMIRLMKKYKDQDLFRPGLSCLARNAKIGVGVFVLDFFFLSVVIVIMLY